MATNWKSQQGDGMYSLQFETDDIDKYKLVEKASQMAIDGIADVAEVRHGEWVYDGDCFHCSACNRTYQLGSLQTIYDVKRCWKYCANCGAKMDGGGKE